MSARNRLDAKRRRRAHRTLAKGREPAYIDLIDYVKLRTRCTTGMAKKVLLSGALMVDSHPVGFKYRKGVDGTKKILDPYLPAEHRSRIVVKDLSDA